MGGEQKASALKRPFGGPYRGPSGALLVLVRCLSGTLIGPFKRLLAQSCGKRERCAPRSREKMGTTHNVRIESFMRVILIVIFVTCGFSPCPLNPEESHPKKKNPKIKIDLLLRPPFLPHTSRRLRASVTSPAEIHDYTHSDTQRQVLQPCKRQTHRPT